jgi:hypothetical protein
MTVHSLFRWHPSSWHLQPDIKHPFPDERHAWKISGVWIFDIDRDDLTLKRSEDKQTRISLQALRDGSAKYSDMQEVEQAPLISFDPALTYYSYKKEAPNDPWSGQFKASERQLAFCGRMMKDFAIQWRHVLKSRCNDTIFLKLASAITRIWSCDFNVLTRKFRAAKRMGQAELESLPEWPTIGEGVARVVHLARCGVVMCQHMNLHAIMSHIRADIATGKPQKKAQNGDLPRHPVRNCHSIIYVVLSMREVILIRTCTVALHNHTQYTDAVPLWSGEMHRHGLVVDERAMDYLSIMNPFPESPHNSHLLKLPNELRDMILEYASDSSLERARIGCLLGIGREFRWRSDSGQELEQRGSWSLHDKVTSSRSRQYLKNEDQILFGGRDSGLSYPHT